MIGPMLLVGGLLSGRAAPLIERIRWLSGCWLDTARGAAIEEQWMAPRGGVMLGMGRTVRADTLREYELVLVRDRGSELVYEAHPSGQPAATFRSTLVSDSQVVFRNPGHDYPQEVGYRRIGADSLLAWIDGTAGTRSRRIEFPYRRVSCGAP
jgi:hypothetical protein